eukprot:4513267-Prymnesium_polylepis.1
MTRRTRSADSSLMCAVPTSVTSLSPWRRIDTAGSQMGSTAADAERGGRSSCGQAVPAKAPLTTARRVTRGILSADELASRSSGSTAGGGDRRKTSIISLS